MLCFVHVHSVFMQGVQNWFFQEVTRPHVSRMGNCFCFSFFLIFLFLYLFSVPLPQVSSLNPLSLATLLIPSL